MRDFFKRLFSQLAELWQKWSATQRIVLLAVVVIAIIGSMLVLRISGEPTSVALFRAQSMRQRI